MVWIQCSSFSTGLHDHTYHMIYFDETKNLSIQQMFKRKRFLVEIDSDFLFKKVRKYVNVNIYVHLEFFDQPTNPENETCVSYYCFFAKFLSSLTGVFETMLTNSGWVFSLDPHCNISPSNPLMFFEIWPNTSFSRGAAKALQCGCKYSFPDSVLYESI